MSLFQYYVHFSGEYGGWREALDAEDYRSIFVLAEPAKIPRHNFYEFVWLLKTGGPRVVSKEKCKTKSPYLSVHLHMFYVLLQAKNSNFHSDDLFKITQHAAGFSILTNRRKTSAKEKTIVVSLSSNLLEFRLSTLQEFHYCN